VRRIAAGCLLLLAATARAETLASIRGAILLREDRYPLPGAEVTLKNPGLSVLRRTSTDGRGRFTFAAVPPGDGYEITVDELGFPASQGKLGHLFGGKTLFVQGEVGLDFNCPLIRWSERYLTPGYFEPAPWPADQGICL
jgi:carboxypeptidase family protein